MGILPAIATIIIVILPTFTVLPIPKSIAANLLKEANEESKVEAADTIMIKFIISNNTGPNKAPSSLKAPGPIPFNCKKIPKKLKKKIHKPPITAAETKLHNITFGFVINALSVITGS